MLVSVYSCVTSVFLPSTVHIPRQSIVGPAKLPAAIVTKLNEEINKILADPDFHDKLSGEALNPMPMTPAQFGKYMASEVAHWTRVAHANKIELAD